MDAYAVSIEAHHARKAAEFNIGSCAAYLYEAHAAGEAAAIADARRKLRTARRELHRAIDLDRTAYDRLLAVQEDLDEKRRKREAAKARRVSAAWTGGAL